MNYEVACRNVEHIKWEAVGERVKVGVPIRTGTHHTIALFERTSSREHRESWRGSYPTQVQDLEIDVRIGDVVYQRTTSPASAAPLERYGTVVGDHRVDWGTDADWVVDFGPMGDATRRGLRSPTAFPDIKRGRVIAPEGEEVVLGGATKRVHDASTD